MKKFAQRRKPGKSRPMRPQLTPEIQALYTLEDLIGFENLSGLCSTLLNNTVSPAERAQQQDRPNWRRVAWIAGIGTLLFLIIVLTGCDSSHTFGFATGYKPQQNALKITTADGQSYLLSLNDTIPAKNLIALQTALSNTLLLQAEIVEQEAATIRHRQNLTIFYTVVGAICFLGVVTACTVVAVAAIRKGAVS